MASLRVNQRGDGYEIQKNEGGDAGTCISASILDCLCIVYDMAHDQRH